MKTKVLEIRDAGTCIPALAIKMEAADAIEDRYLWRCGYPREAPYAVVLMHLATQEANVDPYHWTHGRTMQIAHLAITERFDELRDGDVVDVRTVPHPIWDMTGMECEKRSTPAAPEIWTPEKESESSAEPLR